MNYHAIAALNATALKTYILRGPAAFIGHAYGARKPPTPAMEFGTCVHAHVLEDRVLWVGWSGARRGKEWTEFKAKNEGTIILNGEETSRAFAIRDAVTIHDAGRQMLSGGTEVTGEATWTVDGMTIPVKGRADAVTSDDEVWDLKTTADSSPEGWGRTAVKYGAHIQAWVYMQLFRRNTFRFLAVNTHPVEGTDHYPVHVYTVDRDSEAYSLADYQCRNALSELVTRYRSGNWMTVNESRENQLEVPKWMK